MSAVNNNRVQKPAVQPEPPKIEPKPAPKPDAATENATVSAATAKARRADVQIYGAQRRDRIEEMYGAGAAGASAANDVRLRSATAKADAARRATFDSELAALKNFEAQTAAKADTSGYRGARSFVEVAQRADDAYRAELKRAGFTPADVRGTSVVKAADFMTAEAARGNGLSALAPDQVRARVAAGDAPTYVVRLVKNEHSGSSDATLAYYKKQQAWVATADELAGAKLDLFETMRRIGYPEKDVQEARRDIADRKAKASDWSLAVIETSGTRGRTAPTWDAMINRARGDSNFARYDFNDPAFTGKVKDFQSGGMDYAAHRQAMDAAKTDIDVYRAQFPPQEAEAFRARYDIEIKFGANPLYTGDGTTLRPDTHNGRIGGREFFIDNIPLRDQQRATFVPMQDRALGDQPPIQSRQRINNIAENPLRLRSEARTGGIVGGAISAVTSLPEVFEQARTEGVAAAARTLIGNTALGAGVGAISAAGERIVGNAAENVLARSGIATRGFERLYANGAARNFVQRLAGAESVVSTQAFTGAARQIAGRVAGGSIVGGAVNGAFSAVDQIGAWRRGEVSGSQAIGTVTGEVGVGLAAGATGAAAGAAIGSVVPIAGTAVGAVVGFVVGVGVGAATDYLARRFGADKAIARTVTAGVEHAQAAFSHARTAVSNTISQARETVGNAVNEARQTVGNAIESARSTVSNAVGEARNRIANAVGNPVSSLKSVFGW